MAAGRKLSDEEAIPAEFHHIPAFRAGRRGASRGKSHYRLLQYHAEGAHSRWPLHAFASLLHLFWRSIVRSIAPKFVIHEVIKSDKHCIIRYFVGDNPLLTHLKGIQRSAQGRRVGSSLKKCGSDRAQDDEISSKPNPKDD